MNEKKKLFVLLMVVVGIVLFTIIGSIIESNKSTKYLDKFYSDLNGTENKLVLIGRDDCSWCKLYQPVLDFYKEQYGFEYTYVNTNELTEKVFNKLLKDIEVDGSDFGTPMTLMVSGGKVVDSLHGYVDEPDLFDFLKKYDFLEEESEMVVDYIKYSDYERYLKSNENEIIVIGQTTCSYCIKAKPILNKVAVDYGVDINYLDVTKLSESELTDFQESLEYLSTNEWGTPLTLIIRKGEVIDSANGMLDYDGYVELFKKNDLID